MYSKLEVFAKRKIPHYCSVTVSLINIKAPDTTTAEFANTIYSPDEKADCRREGDLRRNGNHFRGLGSQ